MLAVINRIAGGSVRKRIGAAAQERTPFEQYNPLPRLGQIDGGGQPGEAATQN